MTAPEVPDAPRTGTDGEELPPKPEIPDMPPEEGEEPPSEQEEEEASQGVEFLNPDEARNDDTVDDEEATDRED